MSKITSVVTRCRHQHLPPGHLKGTRWITEGQERSVEGAVTIGTSTEKQGHADTKLLFTNKLSDPGSFTTLLHDSCLIWRGSLDGQDSVVGLPGPADLDTVEAGGGQHAWVLGGRVFFALGLHQHVEGEDLGHDRTASVLKQQSLHQENSPTYTRNNIYIWSTQQSLLFKAEHTNSAYRNYSRKSEVQSSNSVFRWSESKNGLYLPLWPLTWIGKHWVFLNAPIQQLITQCW